MRAKAMMRPNHAMVTMFWAMLGLAQIHSRFRRQNEVERSPLALFARRPDAPTMLANDALTDCQPQPCPTRRARVRGIPLLEAVENMLQLIGRNAPALIANLD